MAAADPWADRAFLRGNQYKTEANLAARQSIYAYQHPRINLQAAVLDLAVPAPSATIVDIGCGNGLYLAELARRGFAGRVLGVDLSFGMLAAARERLRGTDSRAALASADATLLPLRDGTADLSLAPHMLYHVPDPADAVRELRRVTRPGGRVVIVLNGASHLGQLRMAVAEARGEDLEATGERVTLDNGESLAKCFFPKVTRHDFVAELRVPTVDPIVDYVRSMVGTSHHANPGYVVRRSPPPSLRPPTATTSSPATRAAWSARLASVRGSCSPTAAAIAEDRDLRPMRGRALAGTVGA